MFTTLFLLASCCSLLGTLSADPISTGKYIDGTQHTINNIGTKYTQRVSNHGQCSVELDQQSKILNKGEIIKIKNKWYKVEECRLNRAYPVSCGSKLFYQLRDLACSFVEENSDNKKHIPRQTKNALIELLGRTYYNACCESACTIYELVQYCPTKW